jgi:DNA repair photolyase
MSTIKLIKSMYKCQDVPIVVFGTRCPSPCLYCGLKNYQFDKGLVIAEGLDDVIKMASKFKGAYLSPVTDCFLPENCDLTHYILEETWKLNPVWVPLVITKQIIPNKTLDLLSKNKDRLVLQISVPTLNGEIAKNLEPGSATIYQRLEMINNLTNIGINVICVVMPYFEFDDPALFAQNLSRVGVKRVITATGVLTEETIKRMLHSTKEEIKEKVESYSFIHGGKYYCSKERRIKMLSILVSNLNNFGIRTKVCTSDNHDLEDTSLPLCHNFNHKNFSYCLWVNGIY